MLMLVILIFALSIFLGVRMKKNRDDKKFVWWPTLAAIPVALVVVFMGLANIGNQVQANAAAEPSPREVFVFETPFPGDRFSDLTAEQMASLENSSTTRARTLLEGLKEPTNPLVSKASAGETNGIYTVAVETRRNAEIIVYNVIGLVGKNLVHVACVPTTLNRPKFEYVGSDCEKMANERIAPSASN